MQIKPQTRESIRALVGAVALGSTVGLAIGGAYLAGGLARATVVHAQIQRLAGAASDGFSETALHAAASGDSDAAVLLIAKQHDPLSDGVSDEKDRQAAALADRLEARRDARRLATLIPVAQTRAPAVIRASVLRAISTPAEPFHLRGALDQSRDLQCLTQAVYYESRGEPVSGQRAVAQVILNRVRHPAFPKSICGVVFQGVQNGGCQFSFACDGQAHHPLENAAWKRSEGVAAEALSGNVMAEVGDATHFHVARSNQSWSAGLLKVAQIGAHVFYRFSGHAGSASMFQKQAEPSDGAPLNRPLFASLALSPQGSSAPNPAQLIASASAAVEHAATAVENAAKGVSGQELKAPAPAPAVKPQSAAPVVAEDPAKPLTTSPPA